MYQQINGLLFLTVFFIVRVAMIPYLYWMFASEYHGGSVYQLLHHMHWYCHPLTLIMLTVQSFWLVAALRKVARGAHRIYKND